MPTTSQWSPRPRRTPSSETGFNNWLDGSLRASYGEVVREPVPPELLELIRRNTQAK